MPDLSFLGDLDFRNGDVVIMNDSVVQELGFRYETPKGTHWFYPPYGTYMENIIGEANTPYAQTFVISCIDDGLAQDERIPDKSCKLRIYAQDEIIYCELDIAGRSMIYEVKR